MKKISLRLLILAVCLFAAVFSLRATRAQETAGDDASSARHNLKQGAQDIGKGLEQGAKATGQEVKDAALTTKVKAALLSDPLTKNYSISVDSEAGVVTLKGKVDSDATAKRAGEVVEKVTGVSKVSNQLSWPVASWSSLLSTSSDQHCRRARIKAEVNDLLARVW